MGKVMYLLEPPVEPYSSAKEIWAWIAELKKMPDRPERDEALKDAKLWLIGAGG